MAQFRQALGPYIRGQFHTSHILRELVNPRTRQPLLSVPEATIDHVQDALDSAKDQHAWQTNPRMRRDALLHLAERLSNHTQDIAEIEMLQTGKPLDDAVYEVKDTVDCLRYFAGYADKSFAQSHHEAGIHAFTICEPLGVVGLVTSFNYPLLLTGWKLGPALAAGNSAIIKPAPQTPLSTLALAQLATDILPEGVLSVLPGGVEVGQALLNGVDKLSFTGSTPSGQSIMRSAASRLTPLTLECGGKNAVIVLDDADLSEAASHVAAGAFSNAGQNCCAVSRVLVHEDVHDAFVDALQKETMKWGPVGHGDNDYHYGPLIDEVQYDRVQNHIKKATTQPRFTGETLHEGYYVPPTVFTQVDDNDPLAREEIFGPVLSVLTPFDTITSAIQRANKSPYGLAGAVFSKDYRKAYQVVSQLKVGFTWINTYNVMPPYTSFGGRNLSGYGKDLGPSAMKEFTFTKSVVCSL
ncbi:hypothetical protein DFQ28_011384 [Apophysomyces sp. BC1034]|nr:hypothetical protein DFQ30_004117 [Apophysomyces sp. BC1015]KAG0174397.1 hypothetical protein DFQ29_007507 [Apophysomyces sp. BC1021]KAG0191624.1 hypothetical protein DFQ28_011384 [Apophysomyces sp. BC1034]